MATQTPNYDFSLPDVDGSEDLWGDLLNQNWSDLDALLLARDQDFAALEGRTLTAGDGLSGGGDLSQDRTFAVDGTVVRTSRAIAAGNGLTGGGDLSANRTITMGTPGTLDGGTSNAATEGSHTHAIESTASRTDPSTTTLLQAAGMNSHRTSGDHDGRYYTQSQVDTLVGGITASDVGAPPTSRTIAAGNGLTGGGSLAGNRTITMGTPSSITSASGNETTTASHTHFLSEGTVRTLIAEGQVGGVGTYALARHITGDIQPGSTASGSNLTYASAAGNAGPLVDVGTWRAMGYIGTGTVDSRTGLWMRVA